MKIYRIAYNRGPDGRSQWFVYDGEFDRRWDNIVAGPFDLWVKARTWIQQAVKDN